jgi:hypothetical protein
MSEVLTYAGELTIRTCWCGMRHAIPVELGRELNANPKQVAYCPVGHEYVSKVHTEKRERDLEQRLEWANARERSLRDQLHASELSKASLKGHLTRYRKRVANGVCPVQGCKRHFPNVQAHVATEHPDWLAEHADVFEGSS